MTTSDHGWPLQKMSVMLLLRHYDVVVRSFHHDYDIWTKLKLSTGVVIKDYSSGCAFMIPLFSYFTNIGCWAYVLSGSSYYLFHLWKRRKIRAVLSNDVRLETLGADYVYISERRATKHSCSVTCSRKPQRQTVASALRYSYALPSDLTRNCVHALMLLSAPATVQRGQIGEHGRPKNVWTHWTRIATPVNSLSLVDMSYLSLVLFRFKQNFQNFNTSGHMIKCLLTE